MSVLFVTHEAYLEHLTTPHHPERPARLDAVIAGAAEASVADGLSRWRPNRLRGLPSSGSIRVAISTTSSRSTRAVVVGSTPTP